MAADFLHESLNYLPYFDYDNISNHFRSLHIAIESNNSVGYFDDVSEIRQGVVESPILTIMMLRSGNRPEVLVPVVFRFHLNFVYYHLLRNEKDCFLFKSIELTECILSSYA